MESKAKYILVGVITLTICVLSGVSILWLSDLSGSRGTKRYVTYIRHHSLAGLQVNSDVTMKGIRVGKVLSYEISPIDIERVQVVLSVGENTPVKEDTESIIKRNLLTGLAWVELEGGTAGSRLLTEVPKGEAYPVIREGKTAIDEIAESLPQLAGEIGDVIGKLSQVLNDDNTQAVSRILSNLAKFSTILSDKSEGLSQTITNFEELSSKMLKISKTLESLSLKGNRNIDNISRDLRHLLTELSETISIIKREGGKTGIAVRQGVEQLTVDLGKLSDEVSRAAESVTNTMDELNNPSEILTGPAKESLGPGE